MPESTDSEKCTFGTRDGQCTGSYTAEHVTCLCSILKFKTSYFEYIYICMDALAKFLSNCPPSLEVKMEVVFVVYLR